MRWPDDPYGKTLDDLDIRLDLVIRLLELVDELRSLKGTLRAERRKWEEERELWRGLLRDAMDALESDDLEPRRRMFERLQDVFEAGGAG